MRGNQRIGPLQTSVEGFVTFTVRPERLCVNNIIRLVIDDSIHMIMVMFHSPGEQTGICEAEFSFPRQNIHFTGVVSPAATVGHEEYTDFS